jgi:hypothetical protein
MGMIKRRGNLEQHWVVIYAFLDLSFADRLKMKTYCHLFHKVEKLSQTDSSILLSLNDNYRYQSLCTKTIVARTGISRKHLEYNNKSPQQNAHQVIHKHCHATIISNVNERKMVEIRYNNNSAEPAQTITKHVNLDDISLVLGIHFSLENVSYSPSNSYSRYTSIHYIFNFQNVVLGVSSWDDREKAMIVTDAWLQLLANGRIFAHMKSLHLGHCYNITDSGIVSLARGCPLLTKLNLWNCTHLTDHSVNALARGCRQLTSINLEGCSQITDDSVVTLARNCCNLTAVNFSHTNITNDAVTTIAMACTGMSKLSLINCNQITDVSVVKVAQHCPQLSKLNLGGCWQLTDLSVRALSNHSMELISLSLYGCMNVGEKVLIGLAQECLHLKRLDVNGCQVSKECVVGLRRRYCQLVIKR